MDKAANQKLAPVRVRVEHAFAGVKRRRMVKEVLRNTQAGISDCVMEVACSLQNLRVKHRRRPLQI